ncbi:MAG: hypothetical protein JST49_15205 [Bacteroidetes bacterium]|nr:hypothetical protein [Bacteroidota bacterium]
MFDASRHLEVEIASKSPDLLNAANEKQGDFSSILTSKFQTWKSTAC